MGASQLVVSRRVGCCFDFSGNVVVFRSGEGPWGLVVCPSRELASQTTDVVNFFATALHEGGYPQLRCLCMIGGISAQEQVGTKLVLAFALL